MLIIDTYMYHFRIKTTYIWLIIVSKTIQHMSTTALEFYYDEQVVEFDLSGEDVMVNATEMGKIFGKRPIDFLRQEHTKRFIEEMKTAFPAFASVAPTLANAGNAVLRQQNQLASEASIVRTVNLGQAEGGETWMHRLLALKFAAWLEPRFEVWIYQTIDKVLFENARKTNEVLREKIRLTSRRDELVQELQSYPAFQEYRQIESTLRTVGSRIARNNASQLDIFRGR
nr:KilA-N domain-containing protein [Hymenobacter pini]